LEGDKRTPASPLYASLHDFLEQFLTKATNTSWGTRLRPQVCRAVDELSRNVKRDPPGREAGRRKDGPKKETHVINLAQKH